VVVVCLSKGFNQAGHQQKEVRIAINEAETQPEGTIFIIPIRLEECDIPESLKRWHWVDLFEVGAYEKLLRALRSRADNIGAELRTSTGSDSNRERPIIRRQIKSTPKNEKTNRQTQRSMKRQNSPLEKSIPLSTKPTSKSKIGKQHPFEIIVALIGALATLIVGILGSPITERWLAVTPILTPAARPGLVPPEIITSTPYPIEIFEIDLAGHSIPMQLVPAGEFEMGSEYGVNDGNFVHSVYLDAFYIDVYEVTNVLYKACVSAGACQPPKNVGSYTRTSYYANADFDNYPVINVSWYMAESYCKWRGAQLPTEAQWEKAARGGLSGKAYSWGDTAPVCKFASENGANFNDNAECKATDTQVVGRYSPNGFGLYDMAGNVWEWTGSLYRHYPYISDDGRENLEAYGARVLRGGSWFNVEYLQRVSFRNKVYPEVISHLIGFRCVCSVP